MTTRGKNRTNGFYSSLHHETRIQFHVRSFFAMDNRPLNNPNEQLTTILSDFKESSLSIHSTSTLRREIN